MLKTYEYRSVLGPYINDLILQKRKLGFNYELEAYYLKQFDDYCIDNGLSDPAFDKDFLEEWMKVRETEMNYACSQRISFVRQLSLYLNSIGINSYIPHHFYKPNNTIPYALIDKENKAFFNVLDKKQANYGPLNIKINCRYRMNIEYKILFRLYYCCGLRNNEGCVLKTEDVDLKKGIIRIIHSKGNLDRLVYLADDLNDLLKNYRKWLIGFIGKVPEYFFPGKDIESHVDKTSIDRIFNDVWKETQYFEKTIRKPVVHSLRHGFVVTRMNLWAKEGISFNEMMPYLSAYLGHSSHEDTFYYYHLSVSANRLIREKMEEADRSLIPEAVIDEK